MKEDAGIVPEGDCEGIECSGERSNLVEQR